MDDLKHEEYLLKIYGQQDKQTTLLYGIKWGIDAIGRKYYNSAEKYYEAVAASAKDDIEKGLDIKGESKDIK